MTASERRLRLNGWAGRLGLAAALAWALLAAAPAEARRELLWRPLAVEARLDADGVLWVRESHTMVFSGDWNGGERSFRLGVDQKLDLLSLVRRDPSSGVEVPLVEGSLSRVDGYEWIDRKTLRWRSRLPTDPPFDNTAITYVIEYRLEGILEPRGDRYRLDHDFAFPDRLYPVEGFTLELAIDPIWRPIRPLAASYALELLRPGEGFVLEADLIYSGEGSPAAVRTLPPPELRAVPFLGAALAIAALVLGFYRNEAAVGRFDPPPVPGGIDTGWLEEHLFDLLPEEAGALWDRKVGPPEVAAILARWQAEGKIKSEVEPKKKRFGKDELRLELVAERDDFVGYESTLLGRLFFGNRRETDTAAIRKHYASRGFDPAGTVRSGIERRLKRLGSDLQVHTKLPGSGGRLTLALFLAAVVLMLVEAISRPLPTLQLAMLLAPPLGILYLIVGLIFAHLFRSRFSHLGLWALGFAVPGVILYLQLAGIAFFDRLMPGADFPLQPGLAGTVALALLAVMVWSSLLNNARTRERAGGLRRRQELFAARRLFARELARAQPELDDEWMPHLLALGLGPRVDRWWRQFAGAGDAGAVTTSRSLGSTGSGGGGSWTGGGGAFGGAGATASWAAVAGSVASGVAKPSSGGSGGGGGGGGSSGGGGGGGW